MTHLPAPSVLRGRRRRLALRLPPLAQVRDGRLRPSREQRTGWARRPRRRHRCHARARARAAALLGATAGWSHGDLSVKRHSRPLAAEARTGPSEARTGPSIDLERRGLADTRVLGCYI